MSGAENSRFDVVVGGGGCTGSTFACIAARAGLRVALIENREPELEWPNDSVDLRVFAITRASQCIFSSLGVWDEIVGGGVSPFREMRVWDAGGDGAIHFDCAEIGEAVLGHIIEQRVIQAALQRKLSAFGTAVACFRDTVEDFMLRGDDTIDVELASGQTLQARLLVGADGADSRIRERAGITVHEQDYQQQAIVAVVTTGESHQETAWQRFLPDGPLALLPLRDGRSSIVWSTDTDHATELLTMDDTQFCDALGEAFDYRLGLITRVGERVSFPLQRLHADTYLGGRVALIGDAAHVIHPLAGQGVNLGLLDAAVLAEVAGDAKAAGRDPGSARVLRGYERWRRGDNELMLRSMDGFKLLFGSSLVPVKWLRSTGLNLVDNLGPVKGIFSRYAMGLFGDLPKAARCNTTTVTTR